MTDKVYEFWYNDCVWESADGCISLHKTKKGAEMAMEFHKEQMRKEHDELYKDIEPHPDNCKFDDMCAWGVEERTVLE